MRDKITEDAAQSILPTVHNHDDGSKSMIRLKIFYETMITETTTEAASKTTIELFGYFGGILGFSLGCSILSSFEIVETIILLIHHAMKRTRSVSVKKK